MIDFDDDSFGGGGEIRTPGPLRVLRFSKPNIDFCKALSFMYLLDLRDVQPCTCSTTCAITVI